MYTLFPSIFEHWLTLARAYHPHLGEVHQTLLSKVGCPLLNEGQVCQIHSQIWHAGRVAAGVGKCHMERNNVQLNVSKSINTHFYLYHHGIYE